MCQGPIDYLLQAEEEALEGNFSAAIALLHEADTCTQGYSFPDYPEYGEQRNKVKQLLAAAPKLQTNTTHP